MNVEDFRRFCKDFDVTIAVLSRDRADVLAKYTDRLAQEYVLFYCGEGYDDHEYRCTERIEVPPGLQGRSVVANHALRMLPQRTVIVLGDDMKCITWTGEDRLYRLDDEGFLAMTVNLVVTARDLGVGLFGISEVDIRKTSPLEPFHTRRMVTGYVGIDRGAHPVPIWFDERNVLKEDYDFCLQFLKRDRLVWKDCRYFYSQDRNVLPGGNMRLRTPARELAEVENLKRWWGDDMIRFTDGKQTKHLRIIV